MATLKMRYDQYVESEDMMLGYCLACGAERAMCEPDARKYPCEVCSEKQVYGAQELMLMGKIELID